MNFDQKKKNAKIRTKDNVHKIDINCKIIMYKIIKIFCYLVPPLSVTAHQIQTVPINFFCQPIHHLKMKWVHLESSSRVFTAGLQKNGRHSSDLLKSENN